MRITSGRLLREEGGFTLVELLVAMMMMITVLFALYSIFDMSIRVFSFGNDKVEAVENARIGLTKMEREIRAAYPVNKAANPPDERLLLSPTDGTRITFGNDLNGDRVVDTSAGTQEVITYRRGVSDPSTLQRERSGSSQSAIEYVDDLSFEYLDRFGNPTSYTTAEMVRINLKIDVDDRTQELSTDVSLRNRVS